MTAPEVLMYEMTVDEQARHDELAAEALEHLEDGRTGHHTWCMERMRALRTGEGVVELGLISGRDY